MNQTMKELGIQILMQDQAQSQEQTVGGVDSPIPMTSKRKMTRDTRIPPRCSMAVNHSEDPVSTTRTKPRI